MLYYTYNTSQAVSRRHDTTGDLSQKEIYLIKLPEVPSG